MENFWNLNFVQVKFPLCVYSNESILQKTWLAYSLISACYAGGCLWIVVLFVLSCLKFTQKFKNFDSLEKGASVKVLKQIMYIWLTKAESLDLTNKNYLF